MTRIKQISIYLYILLYNVPVLGDYISPSFIEEQDLLMDSKIFSQSKSCGDIYITKDINILKFSDSFHYLSHGGEVETRAKKKYKNFSIQTIEQFDFRTPGGQIFLPESEITQKSKKEFNRYLRYLLSDGIYSRVMHLLERDKQQFKKIEFLNFDDTWMEIKLVLEELRIHHPGRFLKVAFTLYPEILQDIYGNKEDELRPLLCRFQIKQHNIKLVRKSLNAIIITTLAAVGIGIGAYATMGTGLLTVVPLSYAMASAGVMGIKDISFGLYDLKHKEKSAVIAKKRIFLLNGLKEEKMKLLEKQKHSELDLAERELLEQIDFYCEELNKDRRHFKKVLRSRNFNRLVIGLGMINVGANTAGLAGDPTMLAKIPWAIFAAIGII